LKENLRYSFVLNYLTYPNNLCNITVRTNNTIRNYDHCDLALRGYFAAAFRKNFKFVSDLNLTNSYDTKRCI